MERNEDNFVVEGEAVATEVFAGWVGEFAVIFAEVDVRSGDKVVGEGGTGPEEAVLAGSEQGSARSIDKATTDEIDRRDMEADGEAVEAFAVG